MGRSAEEVLAMKFGVTIVFVDDVPAVFDFYCLGFGLKTRQYVEVHHYGELETAGRSWRSPPAGWGAMLLPA